MQALKRPKKQEEWVKAMEEEDQIVDIFIKALPRPRFEPLRAMLGVIEFASRRSIKVNANSKRM